MDIVQQLNQIATERDIPVAELYEELEESLAVAYKKYIGVSNEVPVTVKIDRKTLHDVYVEKEVVGEVMNPALHIAIQNARRLDPAVEIGAFISVKVDPERFGRIAAQTF